MSDVENNIAFISVIGCKKSGKSLFLNRLLGLKDSEGFRVGGFTEGVWLWTSPIFIEKDNIYVYFLEFEGFSEFENFSVVEEKLLLMAMTLSTTVLIVNNGDYEDDMQRISSILSLYHENIKFSSNENIPLDIQAPNFFWILREKESFRKKVRLNLEKSIVFGADEEVNAMVKALKNEANMIWFDDKNQGTINFIRERIIKKPLKKEIAGCLLNKRIFLSLLDMITENLNENKVLELGNM